MELTLHDTAGHLLTTVVSGDLPTGHHEYTWNGLDSRGRSLASGVYVARLRTDTLIQTRKLILARCHQV